MSFSATLINLEIIILSEVSRKPISYRITYYVESKKYTNELAKQRLTDIEKKLMATRGNSRVGGR